MKFIVSIGLAASIVSISCKSRTSGSGLSAPVPKSLALPSKIDFFESVAGDYVRGKTSDDVAPGNREVIYKFPDVCEHEKIQLKVLSELEAAVLTDQLEDDGRIKAEERAATMAEFQEMLTYKNPRGDLPLYLNIFSNSKQKLSCDIEGRNCEQAAVDTKAKVIRWFSFDLANQAGKVKELSFAEADQMKCGFYRLNSKENLREETLERFFRSAKIGDADEELIYSRLDLRDKDVSP